MANTALQARTSTSLTWYAASLQNPTTDYNFQWSIDSGARVNGPADGTYTKTGLDSGTSPHSAECFAEYPKGSGTWYDLGVSTNWTLSPPSAPTTSDVTFGDTVKSGTINFTKGTQYDSWSGISHSCTTEVSYDSSIMSCTSPGSASYFTGTGNSYNTTYAYSLRTKDDGGAYSGWVTGHFTTGMGRLATPTMTISAKDYQSVTTSIGAVTNATYYWQDLYQSTDGGVTYNTYVGAHGSATAGSYTWTGLSANTYYKVRGYVTASGWLDSNYGWSGGVSTPNIPQLATPVTGPTYVSTTSSTFYASWNSVTSATGYTVRLATGGITVKGPTAVGNVTNYTFTGLNPNTNYVFYVKATASGYRDSNEASQNAWTSQGTQLATPANVRASTVKYKSITFSWDSVTNADQYIVDVKNGAGTSLTGYPKTVGNVNSETPTGLSLNTTYYFYVKAHHSQGWYPDSTNGSTSATTYDTPPAPQFDTNATGKGAGYVHLYWSSVYLASKYQLEYKVSTDTTWIVYSSTIAVADAQVSGLTDGTKYDFRVMAYVSDYNGWTAYSAVAQATPGLRPSNFAWTVTKAAGNDVTVTAAEWNQFTTRINDFRSYKNLAAATFTAPTAGVTLITKAIVDAAINAISPMSPPTPVPASPSVDVTDISASFFNALRDSLNSIP